MWSAWCLPIVCVCSWGVCLPGSVGVSVVVGVSSVVEGVSDMVSVVGTVLPIAVSL